MISCTLLSSIFYHAALGNYYFSGADASDKGRRGCERAVKFRREGPYACACRMVRERGGKLVVGVEVEVRCWHWLMVRALMWVGW